MRKLVIAIFALVLLAGFAFPQGGNFETFKTEHGESFKSSLENNWMQLGILAILICLFFNVLVYMAGFVLQSEQLKKYARAEFLHTTASSMIIFFAVSLLYTLTSGTSGTGMSALDFMGDVIGKGSYVSCGAEPTGKFFIWGDYENFGSGPIGAFKCKVQEKITALDRAYNNVVAANMPLERLTSACVSLFGVQVYCWDWDQDLHNMVEENHLIATKIVGLLVPLHAQYALAEYLQKNMLSVFLPMGLVLRVFPFTRGVGGLFIAIAIGFFFVWPTFFLLTDPTFVKQDVRIDDKQMGMCFTGFKGTSVVLSNALLSATQPGSALASASGRELVYQITIAVLFYPFISLVLALIFVRAMTPLLGGDLGELMRMVGRLG